MNDFTSNLIFGSVFLLLGLFAGYQQGQQDTATKCKRQGSFFVDKEDFECKLKQGKPNE